MSLQLIKKLGETWTALNVFPSVEIALASIGFDDTYVDGCIARSESSGRKVIKDGIWGMVELAPENLRLLDSPILQRLRTIHQLGFTYLTYPSAEHSRFAHSLGMFSVVSRFLQEVSRRPLEGALLNAPYNDWKPDDRQARIAEQAAILHDIGHMPFSHVTEQIMQSHKTAFRCGPVLVDDFIFPSEDLLKKGKLSELLSVAVILSPRFRRFYAGFVDKTVQPDELERIAALILGVPSEPELAGVANLISGSAIDADKIDYINRDAAGCGIAVGVDTSRLFLRSRFLRVQPGELQRLRLLEEPPVTAEVIFVVNASGLDSIEEIGQARTMLFHRVYLHQTTRNAERLLGKALEVCLYEDDNEQFVDALRLWTFDDFGLLRALADRTGSKAAEFARRVRVRQLPKRASAFGRRFAKMSVPFLSIFPSGKDAGKLAKQAVGTALEELRSRTLTGSTLAELEDDLVLEASALAAKLSDAGKHAPRGEPIVSVLPMPGIEEDREDSIILDGEQLNLTSASSVADEQMEAMDIMKATGYVLCDVEWRRAVYLAATKVFYKRTNAENDVQVEPYPGETITVRSASRVLLDENAVAQRIRLSKSAAEGAYSDALEVGYFDDVPRLVPLYVNPGGIDENAVKSAALRFVDFRGQGDWHVTTEATSAFLRQFPHGLRSEVLGLLSSFNVLDRSKLVAGIREGLASIDLGSTRGFVAALSPDSGGSVRTVAEHELKAQLEPEWTFVKTVRDALEVAVPGDTIAFCDDNVTSGSQATAQLLAWMGTPRDDWPEEMRDEHGIESAPLSSRDQKVLQGLNIWIVVAVAGTSAEQKIRDKIGALGLSRFRGVKFKSTLTSITPTLTSDLEDYLSSVGSSVLAWCRHGSHDFDSLDPKEQDSCLRDSLGYEGARGLICTTLNVPVGTLTAFWAPGFYKGDPWMPLLLRRGYLRRLVLS